MFAGTRCINTKIFTKEGERQLTDITESGTCLSNRTSVSLGIFDGVHIGHRAILKAAEDERKGGLETAVFTFLCGTVTTKSDTGLIYPDEIKRQILNDLGVDYLFSPEFSMLKDLSAEEFFYKILIKKMGARVVCCGEDFRFGKEASAGVKELKSLCKDSKVKLNVISPVMYKGQAVSSTRIKRALITGDLKSANKMLSCDFGYCEKVVHGRELGRTLDFPTINQQIPSGTVIPKFGVYLTEVFLDGKKYRGVSNIGVKPTVGTKKPLIETHILNFCGNLYGKQIRVNLKKFMREEVKFDSISQLKIQVCKDIENAGKEVM